MARTVNAAGKALIKSFEGLKDGDTRKPGLQPYVAPEGQLTTGWGHVLRPGVDDWMKEGITQEQAEQIFQQDLDVRAAAVEKLLKVTVNDNEFAALVSFTFNAGVEGLKASTLLKKLNSRTDPDDMDLERVIANEFLKWDKFHNPKTGAVEVSPGLSRRRQAEAHLYMTEPPKGLGKSVTLPASAVTAAAGSVGLAQQVNSIVAAAPPTSVTHSSDAPPVVKVNPMEVAIQQAPTVLQQAQDIIAPTQETLHSHNLHAAILDGALMTIVVGGAVAVMANRVLTWYHEKKNRGVTI